MLGTLFFASLVAMLGTGSDGQWINEVRAQVLAHEGGVRTKMYRDSVGIETIGVGFNLRRDDAEKLVKALGLDHSKLIAGEQEISETQALALLEIDLAEARKAALALFPNFDRLSDVRKRVVVDMAFNLGRTRLAGFGKMIDAINREDFEQAANEMQNSKWYEQVKSRGKTLVGMMRTDKAP